MHILKSVTVSGLVLSSLMAFFLIASSPAQAISDTASITADIVEPLCIMTLDVNNLAFGTIIPVANGTVCIDPDDYRSYSGVQVVPDSIHNAAHFKVSGVPDKTFSITLPTSTIIRNEDHTQGMRVDSFVSNPSGTGLLNSAGISYLNVGATLHVPVGQAVGHYVGSFMVTVAYD